MKDSAADFDYHLPPERIAQEPARPRDNARLLHVGTTLSDHTVQDLPDLLRPGDILVSNDTRVIPAQLTARRGDATIGITLDRPLPDGTWHALARNARRLHIGDTIHFDTTLTAEITQLEHGDVTLRFNLSGNDFDAALHRVGALALPPYITRPTGPSSVDDDDYQTIFGKNPGAVAAPTAGLHFTPRLLAALDDRKIQRTTLTLHVGAGTFLPLRTEKIADHRMHAERGIISEETIAAIEQARKTGGRLVAVGTTTLRLLESVADENGRLTPFTGETEIFIRPGYKFRAVDLLLTNFHLPRSTLFMLVCAFSGHTRMHDAYAHAIAEKYRFYSYGDACLLHRT